MHSRFALLVSLGFLLIATVALAHEEATGVVKERMDLMDSQKDAMKVIGNMVKGKTRFDAAEAAKASAHVEETAGKIPELFPEGSNEHPSEAKPEIWEKWDEFEGDAEALGVAAADLTTALDGGDDGWKAKFKGVVDACKTCHKSFREEDD